MYLLGDYKLLQITVNLMFSALLVVDEECHGLGVVRLPFNFCSDHTGFAIGRAIATLVPINLDLVQHFIAAIFRRVIRCMLFITSFLKFKFFYS